MSDVDDYLASMFTTTGPFGESLGERLAWDQVAHERQCEDPFRVRHDFGWDDCSWIAACGATTYPPSLDERGLDGGRDFEHAPGDVPCVACVRIGQAQAMETGELVYLADMRSLTEGWPEWRSRPGTTSRWPDWTSER